MSDYVHAGVLSQTELMLFRAIKVGGRPDIYTRPYVSTVDNDSLSNLVASIDRNADGEGGVRKLINMITQNKFIPSVGGILHPKQTPDRKMIIPNGLQVERWVIWMVVDVTNPYYTTRHVYNGYTEHNGSFSIQSGLMDPNTKIIINKKMEFKMQNRPGTGVVIQPTHIKHFIIGDVSNGTNIDYLATPANAISALDTATSHMSAVQPGLQVNGIGKTACAMHNDSSNYFTTLAGSWLQAHTDGFNTSFDNSKYSSQFSGEAEDLAGAVNCIQDPLYIALKAIVDNHTATYVFPYSALQEKWSRPPEFWSFTIPPQGTLQDLSNYTERWDTGSTEGYIAYLLATIIPSLLLDYCMGAVNIRFTNMGSIDGTPHVMWLDSRLTTIVDGIYNQGNTDMTIFKFNTDLKNRIWEGFLKNICVDCDIIIKCNTFDSGIYEISINGQQHRVFSAPHYCDAQMSPQILTNVDDLFELSSGMYNATAQLYNAFSSTSQQSTIFQ
jgi:hypothetical protein